MYRTGNSRYRIDIISTSVRLRCNLQSSTTVTNAGTASKISNGQIPLCRLARDVRDKPVTSPLAQIPLRQLPRNFPGRKLPRPGKFLGKSA